MHESVFLRRKQNQTPNVARILKEEADPAKGEIV